MNQNNQDFINSNSGIASRIGYTLNFKDYTEEELARIREDLTTHQNEKQKGWVEKYNQMKEAYDREVMQGD